MSNKLEEWAEKELLQSGLSDHYIKMQQKMWDTMFHIHMAGTHVSLNEKGEVVARVLDIDELLKLKELYDDFKDIPNEYSIYNENGEKPTQ